MSRLVLPSHQSGGSRSAMAWLASTAGTALMVSALGAWAFSMPDEAGMSVGAVEEPVVLLALAPLPAIEAISEPSPDLVDQAPAEQVEEVVAEDLPDPVTPETPPELPLETPDLAEPVLDTPPEVEEPPAEIALPKPKPRPEPKPEKKADKKPDQKKDKPKDQAKKKPSEAQAEQRASRQTASAQTSAGSGKAASKSYAASVMKKVQSTRKKRAGEKGTAQVSFTVAANGGLQAVKITRSSGSAKVDEVALEHIRRSAPFPVPPEGVGRSFSFDFVAK